MRDQNHNLRVLKRRATLRGFAAAIEGSTAIEYALLASLIAITVLGAVRELGATIIGLPLALIIDAFTRALSR